MAIIAYDPDRLFAYGSITFSFISGELSINIWENIWLDLQNVPAFMELQACYLTGFFTPFIQVVEGIDAYGFITAPEARYKIGSYSYGCGYTIERFEDGSISSTPIRSTPYFIVYPTQCLEVARFCINTPNPVPQQYEVTFDPSSPGGQDIWILSGRSNSSSSPNNLIATTFNLNLNTNLVANLKAYYSFSITALQYFADDREFQPILV